EPVDVTRFYEDMSATGLDYGPVFQGIRAVWRRDGETFAEIAAENTEDGSFGLHPALWDAVLQTMAVGVDHRVRLPFSWKGVRLHATGATTLRARLTQVEEDGFRIDVADATGRPVVTIDRLSVRPVARDQITSTRDGLYELAWTPTTVPDTGFTGGSAVAEVPETGVHAALAEVHGIVRHWVRQDPVPAEPLVVVTRDALGVDGSPVNPSGAAVWGLLRSAQEEHPGLVTLLDLPAGAPLSDRLVTAAMATRRPRLAVRGNRVLEPRLVAARVSGHRPPLANGTVLITGGTGTLGSLIAEHLVTQHHVKHLHLISRRGPDAPNAEHLHETLTQLGATVTITACDITDPDQLAAAVHGAEPPLSGVIHTAGVLHDATFTALTPDDLNTTLRPKAQAAQHLHRLTRDTELAAFVLFSSIAATIGNAGQAAYSAANAAMEAVVADRRAQGLSAVAIAWGLWADTSEMTSKLGQAELHRAAQRGLVPMSAAEALAMFDAALTSAAPTVIAAKLDLTRLRTGDTADPLLRTLVHTSARRRTATTSTDGPSLATRLAPLSPAARARTVLNLVRHSAGSVLGHSDISAIGNNSLFTDLGFDSLTGVELRNSLTAESGVQLPATLIFDHPTPQALAAYIVDHLPLDDRRPEPALRELDRLESALPALLAEESTRTAAADRLRRLLAQLTTEADVDTDTGAMSIDAENASIDDLFDFLDNHPQR
ncbi:MAG TPA: type I polyketide synthase, partial [Umezawaea sp.]|nr:type I polyketide synthase [Umezawaea sp.]